MSRKKGRRSASATQRFVETLEVRRLLAAVLVKDINTQNADAASLGPIVDVNGTLYFSWLRADIGLELWKTDGTAEGTVLIKDINPGTAHGLAGPAAAYHNQLYFIAQTPATGRELWKSDGTEAGTQLVKELVPGTGDLFARGFFEVNDKLLFVAFAPNTGLEWFITDGTDAGTHILKDLNPGAFSGVLSETGGAPSGAPLASAFNGAIYFSGSDGSGGYKLWKTDGTEAGTVIANPSGPALSSSAYPWQASFNGALYYTVPSAASTSQLWRIDASGATMPITIGSNQNLIVSRPVAAGGQLYFLGGGRLYQTQGQPETTMLTPGLPATVTPTSMTSAAGQLFFVATDSEHGQELWVTDGTSTRVIDVNPGTAGSSPTRLFQYAGALYFAATDGTSGYELWRSDGTTTTRVADINPGASGALTTTTSFATGTRLWFAANDGVHGTELWSSDGTAGGTAMVKELDPTTLNSNPSASYPYGCCQTNGQTYPMGFFNATTNGTSRFWRSDGTAQGTFMLTGLESYALTTGFYALPFGNGILFSGNDPIHGAQLWSSDGTQAGTRLVKNIATSSFPDSLKNIGGRLFFSAWTPSTGRELWISDGTEAGTHLAVDLTPGTGQGLNDFAEFVQFQGLVYFDGWLNGQHGLLRSGGTPDTTEMVITLTGGDNSVAFRNLTAVGERLFFTVDGNLYTTDGTGYTLMKAVSPYYYGISDAVAAGDTLLLTADDGNNGRKLWRSDGTAAGTYVLASAQANRFNEIALLGGSAYVVSSTPSALWKTDGTIAGTAQVKSFPLGSTTGELLTSHGRLYFDMGDRLWQSDGTEAGTIQLQPLRAPTAPGRSFVGMDVNGTLLFNGWEEQTGVELWKIAPPQANAGTGYAVNAGSAVPLDASASSDPDPAEILQYKWDLDGDGLFGETGPAASRGNETGSTPTFFSSDLPPGTFPIQLRVTDSIGLDSVSTAQITITPPPFMNFSADAVIDWSGTPGSRILTLHAGVLTLSADLSSVYPGISIVADNAAAIHFSATQHIKQLTLLDSATLDLGDASLFVSAPQPPQTLADIRALIKSGKIASSTSPNDSRLGIGYLFDTASNSIQVTQTLLGDLNLDKTVSVSDFIDLSSHFGQSNANWSDGDMNYDDQVSIADFLTLASNFNQSYSPSAPQPPASITISTQNPAKTRRISRSHVHHRRAGLTDLLWSAPTRRWKP